VSFLLDTNICIYIINRKPLSVIKKMQQFAIEELSISTITVAELELGVEKSQHPNANRIALIEFLSPLHIRDFDQPAARAYAELRAVLERKGTPIGALDMLIAAHAISLGLTLVTNNLKEFRRIPKLKTDNWI
jgi:tRNA(fMet)-specific endonuclease VapC